MSTRQALERTITTQLSAPAVEFSLHSHGPQERTIVPASVAYEVPDWKCHPGGLYATLALYHGVDPCVCLALPAHRPAYGRR